MTLSTKKSIPVYELSIKAVQRSTAPNKRSSWQAFSMRREGRQHGMVLCFEIFPELSNPGSRWINKFDTVPTTKNMTKVSSKPTNHSRFTSKCLKGSPRCIGCHDHPVSKASTKAKKSHKKSRYDVNVNPSLVSHSVCSTRWVRFNGQSASGLLNQLIDSFSDYEEFDNEMFEMSHDCSDESSMFDEERSSLLGSLGLQMEDEVEADMGFCFVEFARQLAEDDDWCLVG